MQKEADIPAEVSRARKPRRWRNWYVLKEARSTRFGRLEAGEHPGWFLWPSYDIAIDKGRLADSVNTENTRYLRTVAED